MRAPIAPTPQAAPDGICTPHSGVRARAARVALSMLAGLGGMLLIGLAIGLMPGRAGAAEDEGIGTTAVAELPAEAGTASAIAPDEVTTDANELLATTAPPSDQIHASDGPAG